VTWIIITLNRDIRSQFSVHTSQNLITLCINNLDRVIFDSQEDYLIVLKMIYE
jgi:hypothetical protein